MRVVLNDDDTGRIEFDNESERLQLLRLMAAASLQMDRQADEVEADKLGALLQYTSDSEQAIDLMEWLCGRS